MTDNTEPQENHADRRTVVFQRRGTPQTAIRVAIDIREAAAMIGVSYMTLWRAVRDDQFPAIRIRDRIVVPLKAIDMLLDAATSTGEFVNAADWTAHWTASSTAGGNAA